MRIQRKFLIIGGLVLALVVTPFAIAAGEGDPILGGVRNPSPVQTRELQRETEIIADVRTYGTRQSNKSDNGGGAIYGCRSAAGGTPAGNEPCIRANNLSSGRAFEFESDGDLVGRIDARGAGGDGTKPFTTNATGVADGLNADRVDGRHADELIAQAVAAMQATVRFADVDAGGAVTADRGVAGVNKQGTGVYDVVFDADVAACVIGVTVVGEDAGDSTGYAAVQKIDARTLRVRTWDAIDPANAADAPDTGNPLEDNDFHIVAHC